MPDLQKELRFIEENLGAIPLKTIADKLGKPVNTIEMTLKRKKGSASTKIHTGMLTAGELAKILKVDRNTVMGWIRRHGLASVQRVTHTSKRFTFIDIELFWSWAADNKDKIDFSKLSPHVLPPQPKWVEFERKTSKTITKYKAWTVQEEKRLLKLVSTGMNFEEIAAIMDRTPHSIEKKHSRIKAALPRIK
ncbi:helix-turn-helix domain-containing protein [Bacillus sp. T33-2]|uniref:helix-turn-helix domain-containing protein n=1 Tax=Bacillus sp. T33-2 TaxID=2054168 RepID=UPI000C75918C|nr:helix-turn-helix domain-containing protein [Bacillus sp. T33-2]PLR99093.1 DNA-binding protein [Bacillus sp. T33-2]